MTASRTPSTARLLFASSHPGPTVTVTVLAAVIAAAVGHPVWLVVLVALTVVAGQLSIGLANDWIDADRDRAVGRSDKPVARGLIAVGTVRAAAYATAGIAVVLSLFLGPIAALAHLVLVAAGWAYDAGLKRSVWSVAPFVVAFGLLPVVSVAAGPEGQWPAWWAIATGAVFGIAIHCTNVLPDLVDDAATGVRGFPHRLGLRGAGSSRSPRSSSRPPWCSADRCSATTRCGASASCSRSSVPSWWPCSPSSASGWCSRGGHHAPCSGWSSRRPSCSWSSSASRARDSSPDDAEHAPARRTQAVRPSASRRAGPGRARSAGTGRSGAAPPGRSP